MQTTRIITRHHSSLTLSPSSCVLQNQQFTAINTWAQRPLKNVSVKWKKFICVLMGPLNPTLPFFSPLTSSPTPPTCQPLWSYQDSGFLKSSPVYGLCRGDGSMHFQHQIASRPGFSIDLTLHWAFMSSSCFRGLLDKHRELFLSQTFFLPPNVRTWKPSLNSTLHRSGIKCPLPS